MTKMLVAMTLALGGLAAPASAGETTVTLAADTKKPKRCPPTLASSSTTARAVAWSCGRTMAIAVCSALTAQYRARRCRKHGKVGPQGIVAGGPLLVDQTWQTSLI